LFEKKLLTQRPVPETLLRKKRKSHLRNVPAGDVAEKKMFIRNSILLCIWNWIVGEKAAYATSRAGDVAEKKKKKSITQRP